MKHYFYRGLIYISFICIVTVGNQVWAQKTISSFPLHKGDLLFQDLDCGSLCDAIVSATASNLNKQLNVSHVGMVVSTNEKEPEVIEAYQDGVVVVPVSVFLTRSLDENGHPKVLVGRLKKEYQDLIPEAIVAAEAQIGQPYNDEFVLTAKGFYCSQLIAYAFQQANDKDFFQQKPMNFQNLKTHHYPQAWINYFKKINKPIPQGQPGTNPADMLHDTRLDIVYAYNPKFEGGK